MLKPVSVCLVSLLCFLSACETSVDGDKQLPLAGPSSVQLMARNGAIVAQWTRIVAAQGITPSYEVYYSRNSEPRAAQLWAAVPALESNLVQSSITGLENYAGYYVWVKAVYAGLGVSGFSPTQYARPIPPPSLPGDFSLSAVSGEQMLNLSWPSVKDASSYKIFCAAGAGGVEPPDGSYALETPNKEGTSGAALFELGNGAPLVNGVSYTVWLQAVNTAGNSLFAKISGVAPEEARDVPQTAPSGVSVTSGAKKLFLQWTPVAGVPSYKVYYGTQNNFSLAEEFAGIIPTSMPLVEATLTGLANKTPYYVWVQSWNSRCTTRYSSPSGAAPSAVTPQAKPPVDYDWPPAAYNIVGKATAFFPNAVDQPPSVWWFEGKSWDRTSRFQEVEFGNLYCDGMAWFARDRYPEENIDFVFLNGAIVEGGLREGDITIANIMGATRDNTRNDELCFITLKGKDLISFSKRNEYSGNVNDELEELFDQAANVVHMGRGGANTGWFAMVSKEVRYTIQYYVAPDLTEWLKRPNPQPIEREDSEPYYHGWIKDGADGSWKGSLTIGGKPVDPEREYRILTTDYLTNGEFYTVFYTRGKNKRTTGVKIWKAIVEYIWDAEKVTPYLDGRVKIEGGVPLNPPWIPGNLMNPNPPAW